PDYRQLEYLKQDMLVGWIGDSLDIWSTEGKFLRRIHYGFRGGKPPRFAVNLPLIQRGGNELSYFGQEKGVMGVYSRDSDFLAPRTIKWYETFYPNSRFYGVYRIGNQASIVHKGSTSSRDSSLTDSLYVMLVEYKGEFQLLANQGRELFRQLPFSFPSKGKKEGVFKGYHLGRVGPLYPSIYYAYAKPKLEIKGDQIKLELRFTEKKQNSKEERIFRYQLSGKRSTYNETLTLISNPYANAGLTPIYQLKQGETASVITSYGYELIPAGTYKKFLAGRGNSIVAQTLDNQIICLNRAGKPMDTSTFIQLNRLKFEGGVQYLKGGSMRGGILFRDSLEFMGPFLPDHRLFILNQDTIFFVDPNQEVSLIYEPAKDQITDTIPGDISKPNSSSQGLFPYRIGQKKGFLNRKLEVLIPAVYQDISVNPLHQPGEIFFNAKKDNLYGIINLKNEWVLGPTSSGHPRKVWNDFYLKRENGKQYLLNNKWEKIHESGIDDFPYRWNRIIKGAEYIPFKKNGKYGVLSISEGIVEAAQYDSLNTNVQYSLNYFSLGKGDDFYLVDNARKEIYPDPYKQILNFYQFVKDPQKRQQYNKRVKAKYETFIALVLQERDLSYKLLLRSGEIIKLEDLEN
ncbi:MAG: hypothetical protein AAGD28_25955, partial [Bacteroidota bacterium]